LSKLIHSFNKKKKKKANLKKKKFIGVRLLKEYISLATCAYVNLSLLRKIGRLDQNSRIISNSISSVKNKEIILFFLQKPTYLFLLF
jgi:hypothetical protein